MFTKKTNSLKPSVDRFAFTLVCMPASDALFRPYTPGLLETTTTISAELDGRLACSMSACRLVPQHQKRHEY